MVVLTHLDPHVLERELLLRVDRAHPAAAQQRTLVLVPTGRLQDHVGRRLAERRPAWLGLEVATPSGVARRILAGVARDAEPSLSPRLLDAFVRRILRARPENAWAEFLERRPGTLPRLRTALNDLREAGVSPAEVTAAARGSDHDRALAEIYEAYVAALESPRAGRRTDEAGVIRAALPHAAQHGRLHGHVFVHGAYEWIGIHLDLIRELGQATDVTIFLPARHGARVAGFANDYAQDFLAGTGKRPLVLDDPLPIEQRFQLEALYDEEARPRPGAVDRVAFRHCQGEAAEVRIALREALAAVRGGCHPTEIVITARSLEPYAPAIEQAFESEGLPWTSSLPSPLRRHPLVRDFLLMLEIVAQDFPRRATAEWLRSPRIRWETLVSGPPPEGGQADVWSRRARIIGGLTEWTNDLPRWAAEPWFYPGHDDDAREDAVRAAERRTISARRIGSVLETLRGRLRPQPRTWSAHAALLRNLLESTFDEPGDTAAALARDTLGELLDELPLLETVVGDDRRVPFAELCAWLGEAVDSCALTLQREDTGGIRVLDAMQLRGLTFKRVFLLGLNSGLFPRSAREDAVLGDDLRRRLREQTRRPLAVKSSGNAEERLLLAAVLGAAEERVEVSWQRADESGKARTPSLALREIARVAYGRPDLDDVRRHARHLRSHPTQWLEDLVERPGLLAPGEELLLLSLRAVSDEATADIARRFPEAAPGLRWLAATQSFDIVDAGFDGRVGPRLRPERLSVSALETLGRCPLQFFFNRTLGVRELDDQAGALEIEPRELGNVIHAVLDRMYRTLSAEGLLDPAHVEAGIERADRLLDEARPHLLGPMGPRLARRVPVLVRQLTDRWDRVLRAFVRADLRFWIHGGYRPGGFETEVAVNLDFGEGFEEIVRGRLDRTLVRDGKTLVGDYKTSGNVDRRVSPTNMLRGETLQAPLYRMLAGNRAEVELLGVGPDFDTTDDAHRFEFGGFATETQEAGFLETGRTLLRLRRVGVFPFNPGHHCSFCRFTEGCRRNDPPSGDREAQAEDSRAFHRTQKKSTRSPRLADLETP